MYGLMYHFDTSKPVSMITIYLPEGEVEERLEVSPIYLSSAL
jgi:hypothetical protein